MNLVLRGCLRCGSTLAKDIDNYGIFTYCLHCGRHGYPQSSTTDTVISVGRYAVSRAPRNVEKYRRARV
jgi:hypothetical protein